MEAKEGEIKDLLSRIELLQQLKTQAQGLDQTSTLSLRKTVSTQLLQSQRDLEKGF